MKPSYVSDLTTEQSVTTFLLVCEKEVRSTKEGKPYLRLELGDRSGTIEARMWDQFDVVAKDISRDHFVKVNARVEIRSEEHTSELQSHHDLVCRLLLEKKKKKKKYKHN